MTIENTITTPILHEVFEVRATNVEHVYVVDVELTDMTGERYRADYVSAPDDPFGLAPTVREWLNTNEYEVVPYVAPTIDELRAGMFPITPRQLRLALVRNGTSLATVTSALAASGNEEALIEWEYATRFERMAPALLAIAGALGLTPEAVDTLWATALLI